MLIGQDSFKCDFINFPITFMLSFKEDNFQYGFKTINIRWIRTGSQLY